MACHAIADCLKANHPLADFDKLILDSVSFANGQIRDQQKKLRDKMGATIAGALIKGRDAWVFWFGDVRIYNLRGNQLLFQSEDHSLINEIRKERVVSAKDIDRYGNIVTKSLSENISSEELPVIQIRLVPGDSLILCTDGFWRIFNILTIPDLSTESLKEELTVMEDKMEDNYSVVWVVKCLSSS